MRTKNPNRFSDGGKAKKFGDADASKNLTAQQVTTISEALFTCAMHAITQIKDPYAKAHKEFWIQQFEKYEDAYLAINNHGMAILAKEWAR